MITKNGVLYEPTKADKDKLAKLLDKNGHLVLVWHPDRMYTDPQELRASKDVEKSKASPPGLPLALLQTVQNTNGTSDVFRYYESSYFNPATKRDDFEPKSVYFRDKWHVEDLERQLFFGLYCPMISNSIAGISAAEKDGNYRPWLKIEIAEKVAEEKMSKRSLRTSVDNFILEVGSESDLRDIAAMYRVVNSQKDDINIIRSKLFSILENPAIHQSIDRNYTEFKAKYEGLSKPDVKDEIKQSLSIAIDSNILKYVNNNKCWTFFDEKGSKSAGVLLKLSGNQANQKEEVLIRHLENNPRSLKALQTAVKSIDSAPEDAGDSDN